MEQSFWVVLPVIILAYLLGAIPFGLLLTKYAGLGDIRAIGSGNIGATNVLRTGRKGLALATLVLDGAKGWLAVWLAGGMFLPPAFALQRDVVITLAALAVVVGHMFPVYLRFKGGKGVATTFGAFLALQPWLALMLALIWFGMAGAFQYSSLAALTAVLVALPIAWLVFDFGLVPLMIMAVIVLLVVYKHHENIQRLLAGDETKIRLGRNQTGGE